MSTRKTTKVSTPKQLAADRGNLVKARAAERRAHPKGHQTPAQLAAERANLVIARSVLKRHHIRKMRGRKVSPYPLGSHRITADLNYRMPPVRKPTGVNKKFQARLSPNSYEQRTAWKAARGHHMKKRLHTRRHKRLALKGWRITKRRITPR